MAIVNSKITSIKEVEYATKTYKLDKEAGRIMGYVDGVEAVQQAGRKILATERFAHEIYGDNYGVEIESLIGQDANYVISVLPTNIEEALTVDSRINSISDYSLDATDLDSITPSFQMNTIYGDTSL